MLFDPVVGRLLASLAAIVIVAAVVRLLRHSVARYVEDGDVRYRIRKIVSFLGYLTVVLVIMAIFSDRLAGLTVAFGVAGAGVAFALQEVIASVAGWVALSFGGFYAVGDRVQLGGIRGDVIDIGVLRTTLMECGQWVDGDLYNGRIVRVANSFVFKEPVFNYSGDFPFLWDEIRLPVRYGSDFTLVRQLLHRVALEVVGDYAVYAKEAWVGIVRKYRLEDASVDPMVTMLAHDNWVDFTLRYVVDYRRRRGTKDRLFAGVLDAIEATDGRVRLASATYELVGVPPVEVRLPVRAASQP